MPNVTSTILARGIRDRSYSAPAPGSPPPPPFLAKPTTVARAAVRRFHHNGATTARTYLTGILASELAHANASMRSNAENTVRGLDTYMAADATDARTFVRFGEPVPIRLSSAYVRTTVDVVTRGAHGLSGRAVFWDGTGISADQAEVIAYVYAEAMQLMFPGQAVTDICIWHARRDNLYLVPLAVALARAADAEAALARL